MEVLKVGKFFKKWPFLAVFGLLGISLGCGQYAIQTQLLQHPFPTQMVFKGSVFKVQKDISKIFESNSLNVFQRRLNFPPAFTLYWKGVHHPDEVKIFKNPVNENDVYISCNHTPICKSTVYKSLCGQSLEYLADFQLHLIPQGAKETMVEVIAINSQVMVGKSYYNVRPTTVEENEILKALEKKLKISKNN